MLIYCNETDFTIDCWSGALNRASRELGYYCAPIAISNISKPFGNRFNKKCRFPKCLSGFSLSSRCYLPVLIKCLLNKILFHKLLGFRTSNGKNRTFTGSLCFLSVGMSVCMSVCLYVHLHACLYVCLYVSLYVYLFICLFSVCMSVSRSVCISYLYVCRDPLSKERVQVLGKNSYQIQRSADAQSVKRFPASKLTQPNDTTFYVINFDTPKFLLHEN